ncbi:unnamed protein product [Rhizophagus irregularis]|nr:unnamed protein product [Rhizophagus irregularis]
METFLNITKKHKKNYRQAPLTSKNAHTAVNNDTLGHTVRQSGNILHHTDTQPIGVGNRSGRSTFTIPYNNHNIRINETDAGLICVISYMLVIGPFIETILFLPSTVDSFYNTSFICNLVN